MSTSRQVHVWKKVLQKSCGSHKQGRHAVSPWYRESESPFYECSAGISVAALLTVQLIPTAFSLEDYTRHKKVKWPHADQLATGENDCHPEAVQPMLSESPKHFALDICMYTSTFTKAE